jgi:hypothetical protein
MIMSAFASMSFFFIGGFINKSAMKNNNTNAIMMLNNISMKDKLLP